MSNESLLGLLSTVFTAGLGIINYLTRKLIRDMEKRIEESSFKIARSQDLVDQKIKERYFDISRINDQMRVDIGEMNKALKSLEKNVDILNYMVKTVDEKFKDKIDMLNKNTDAINQLLQKFAVMEQNLNNYGKITIK